ncbi:hypothetical protein ACFV5N_10685 [Streptomyces sp. NPDC059853]|uniref:hypothetical protein n=1 Tax=Streptomyces sp. NPDC059853 TaxID=3346973 RepID=UPI0036624B62
MKWRWDQAAEVPVGTAWDVARVTRAVGALTVSRARVLGVRLGAVLDVPLRGAIEFVVPLGTSVSWPPLPGTLCVGRGAIRWPTPLAAVGSHRHALCGRRWLVPPVPMEPLATNGAELCEAMGAALAHLRLASAALTPGRELPASHPAVRSVQPE